MEDPSTENLIIISEVLDVSIKDLTSNTPISRKNKSSKIGIRDKRLYNSFFDEEKIICERKYDFYSLIIGLFIIIPLLASILLFFSPKLFKLLEPTTSLAIALLMMFYYNSFAELLLIKFIKGKEIDLGN